MCDGRSDEDACFIMKGIGREFGINMYTLLYLKMENQQGPTVQYRELCSVFFASLDGRGFWGRMDTCIRMAESLHCLPETHSIVNQLYSSTKESFKKQGNFSKHRQ